MILRLLLPIAALWAGAYFNFEILPDGWMLSGAWYVFPLVVTETLLFAASCAPLIDALTSDPGHGDF